MSDKEIEKELEKLQENENNENNENENENEENENEENENEEVNENMEEESEEEEGEESEESEDEKEEGEEEIEGNFVDMVTQLKKNKQKMLCIQWKMNKGEEEKVKGYENFMKFLVSRGLQKKNVPYQYSSENHSFDFYVYLTQQIPTQIMDIQQVIPKHVMMEKDDQMKNAIIVVLEENQDESECNPIKSVFEKIPMMKLYIKKEKEEGDRYQLIDCMQNTIQIDKWIGMMSDFYYMRLEEEKEIEVEDTIFEKKARDVKINRNIFTNSVLMKMNDTSKLFLKDPSMNIKLHLGKFRKLMREFPKEKHRLCESLFDVLQEKDDAFYMEEDRAIWNQVKIHKYGKEENLNQFSVNVSNDKYDEKEELMRGREEEIKNKFVKNPIGKYMRHREIKKKYEEKKEEIYGYKIEDNQYSPSFLLEDILFPLIAEKTENFRLVIPMITQVDISNTVEEENGEKGRIDKTTYLISYLYYDHKKIYFYPLYFVDYDENINHIKWEKIMKGIYDGMNDYLENMIRESELYTFAKIQYGGIISPFVEELENRDIPFMMNMFLIVFFQFFYAILNPDVKPNEIFEIFSQNDLNDHYYIFLQFFQEICE